jgi:hypothetical protein
VQRNGPKKIGRKNRPKEIGLKKQAKRNRPKETGRKIPACERFSFD